MINLRRVWICVIFFLVTACSDEEQVVALAFSTESPADLISESIQSQLAREGIQVDFVEQSSPGDIFTAIQDGSIDLGVIEEPDHPIPSIVTIAPLYPSVLHVLHNFDHAPTDLIELIRGSNIYAGPPSGAAHRLIVQLALDSGIRNDEFQILDNPWVTTPDVYFIFGGLLTDASIRLLDGYTLFSFADKNDTQGGSVADAIVFRHHHLKTFLIPKGTYYSLSDQPVLTLSIRTVMISHERFPTDLAQTIATNLFNNAQEYSMEYPLVMRELNTRFNPIDLMFPLHEGSRRFLNRDEPGFIEKNIDVIALVFTLLFALGSGVFTLYRRHLQVKKDRVDLYFSKLLVVRNEAKTLTDSDSLSVSLAQALAVQEEVLQLLIDEHVSADASLVAFLSLSNQIIDELNRRLSSEEMK